MKKIREIMDIAMICSIYSIIVIMINLVAIFIFTQDLTQISYWLSFITLIEGGLGLVAGGGSAMYSPILNKAFEKLFNSDPWTYDRQKKTEQQAKKWIITASFLIIEALILSAI